MMWLRTMWLGVGLGILVAVPAEAQIPVDLQQAMDARQEARLTKDATTWASFTTDDFTVVQIDGSIHTKADRVAQLKSGTPMESPEIHEHSVRLYGDTAIQRTKLGDPAIWVIQVWVKQADAWRVAAVQLTSEASD